MILNNQLESALNWEASFRQAVDVSLAELEEYFQKNLEKLEKAVADCFLRREAKPAFKHTLQQLPFLLLLPLEPRLLLPELKYLRQNLSILHMISPLSMLH